MQPLALADRRELIAIFVGGALGTLARAALVEAFPVTPGSWPWPTFTANLAGAALIGYALVRLQERLPLSAYRRPFVGTGLCGALTTFSAVQVELLLMLDERAYALAAAYLLASVVAGFACVFVAVRIARRVVTA